MFEHHLEAFVWDTTDKIGDNIDGCIHQAHQTHQGYQAHQAQHIGGKS